ncbi:MAG: type II toxin-antitoxin system YafQ family toxin [Collinsella intestinalis]|uniref:Type II toxin-antitoxin system YafQ family toxin n=1 Tax=Collinsella intestinalis TaxID=147207 RepID=A0A943BQF8_9ACTN|nr:type II toxin-antitoxin system YafQ family toxin [Collinsella intestinalis]
MRSSKPPPKALVCGDALPESIRDYSLGGTCQGHRECHIKPDWSPPIASTKRGLSLSPRARGAMASCRGL